jgi:hypothetical protein
MLKAWQAWCSVDIKSFHLELLATEFLAASRWRLKDWFWFDWITRDFFAFLYHRANGTILVPGTHEVMALGDAWQSRALSAYHRAFKACKRRTLWPNASGRKNPASIRPSRCSSG